jgi:ketosteroid isomerase-like protein
MTEPVSRAMVEAFYRAYASRDADKIGPFLDDDVEWSIAGPVEVMQVCGQWRGKAAVIDRFARAMPQVVDFKSLDQEFLLVDGDCSALFGRITCRHVASGRTISHRVAHFARYRGGKVVSLRVINDSLDAAEQFIGHRINLVPGDAPIDSDLIVV